MAPRVSGSSRSVLHCDAAAAWSPSLSLQPPMPPQAVPFARLVCILGHPLARQAASARLRIGAEVDEVVMCQKVESSEGKKPFWHLIT
jgi:hypothetical protein